MKNKISLLFVGNSITLHDKASYWWSDNRGMAASSDDKDYVHRVVDYLKKNVSDDVEFETISGYHWEIQANDRAETLQLLNQSIEKLDSKVNIAVVQLGENIIDSSTLIEDFIDLIEYIQHKAQCKHIFVIGDFWKNDEHDYDKKAACDSEGAEFIDLSDIQNKAEYSAGIGTRVYGDDGKIYTITHNGVARHPGDKGMEYIAERIVDLIIKYTRS